VPDDADYTLPLGKAEVVGDGRDVAIVTYGITVGRALHAARELAGEGIGARVVDLQTIWPLDYAAIADAAAATHRVVVAHEAVRIGGVAGEVAAFLAEHCFDDLDAPVVRLGAAHVPVPFAPGLQEAIYPKAPDIAAVCRDLVRKVR
jgi:pyruvate/2-oxoglutarate/acetoin dehydrogenase E1 component